jgi:integrase
MVDPAGMTPRNDNIPPSANLTVEDVAKRWSVSAAVVKGWVNRGARINRQCIRLNCVFAGPYYRFTEQHLADFSAACEKARRGEQLVPTPTPDEAAARQRTEEFLAKRGRKPRQSDPNPTVAPAAVPPTHAPSLPDPGQPPGTKSPKVSVRKYRQGGRYKAGTIRPVPKMKQTVTGYARARWSEGGVKHQKDFGPWGSAKAAQAYKRFAAEWIERQGSPQVEVPTGKPLFVTELCEQYLAWASGPEGYRKDGELTSEFYGYDSACSGWVELYGQLLVADMKAAHLRTTRAAWVAKGLARSTCNRYTTKIIWVIAWGVGRDLVPVAVLGPLREVEPLIAGKTIAPDPEPIKSVPWKTIEATFPHLHAIEGRRLLLEQMIRIQVLGRMRPGELISMVPEAIDRTTTPWKYVVGKANKNRHKGKRRVIYFGPQARAILGPLLDAAEPGQRLWRFPVLRAGQRTTVSRLEYGRWIEKACVRGGIELWTPNQLRHRGATDVHERYESDADVAAALGNSPEVARQVYVDSPEDRVAKRIAEETG